MSISTTCYLIVSTPILSFLREFHYMDSKLSKNISSLSDQIWFTRKCRIRASERLLSNYFHSNLILVWYSFLTFSFSVYLIKDPDFFNQHTDIIMVLTTGAVFTLSLFIPQLNLKTRYEKLKKNYIAMQGLVSELSLCESKNTFFEIQGDYQELLDSVENHRSFDMLYFVHFEADKNCSRDLSFSEVLRLYVYVFIRTSFITLAYTFPIFSVVFL